MKFVKTEKTTIEVKMTKEELFTRGVKRGIWNTKDEMEDCLADSTSQDVIDIVLDCTHDNEGELVEVTDFELLKSENTLD